MVLTHNFYSFQEKKTGHTSTQIAISFSSILPPANQLSTLLRGHIKNFDAKIRTLASNIFIKCSYILHKANNFRKEPGK